MKLENKWWEHISEGGGGGGGGGDLFPSKFVPLGEQIY